jgi:hypothetical protein
MNVAASFCRGPNGSFLQLQCLLTAPCDVGSGVAPSRSRHRQNLDPVPIFARFGEPQIRLSAIAPTNIWPKP